MEIKTKFNLSEKRDIRTNIELREKDTWFYHEQDVKEFIRKLKEEFRYMEPVTFLIIRNGINKLAGEKLK